MMRYWFSRWPNTLNFYFGVFDFFHLDQGSAIADWVGHHQIKQIARVIAEYVVKQDLPLVFAKHLRKYGFQ